MDFSLDDDSPCVQADLSLVEERRERCRAHCILHIDVVQNDHWVISAEFQHSTFQHPPCAFSQHASGLHSPNKVNDAHIRALEENVGDLASSAWSMAHSVDDSLREAS